MQNQACMHFISVSCAPGSVQNAFNNCNQCYRGSYSTNSAPWALQASNYCIYSDCCNLKQVSLVPLSVAVACGLFFSTGRSAWLQHALSRSKQSYSFTSRTRFTAVGVWAWKMSKSRTASVNTWKVSDHAGEMGQSCAWFCGPSSVPCSLCFALCALWQ